MATTNSMKPLPDIDYLRALFDFNPENGEIRWKSHPTTAKRRPRSKIGSIAGTRNKKGYALIVIDGTTYLYHRIAFKLYYGRDPIGLVDHRDGNPFDDRRANLREATISQNVSNTKLSKNNTSGIKGVSYVKRDKIWRATITHRRQIISLGNFRSPEEAANSVAEARAKLHGEFACDGYRNIATETAAAVNTLA